MTPRSQARFDISGIPITRAIQPKLTIRQPGDRSEQEADRIADRVMSMPEPVVHRQVEEDDEEVSPKLIRRQTEPEEEEEEAMSPKAHFGGLSMATPDVTGSIGAMRGGGQPLPGSTRAFFEPRFGRDFSEVRIHTGSRAADTAQAINARAFTVGRNIAFGAGQYSPDSRGGRQLLAHELTHVVQQGHAHMVDVRESNDEIHSEGKEEAGAETLPAGTKFQSSQRWKGNITSKSISNGTIVVQTSPISWLIKKGVKKAAIWRIKKFIRNEIKSKINKLALKNLAKKFAEEADSIIGILNDPWWVTVIEFIPIIGDIYGGARITKQLYKVWDKTKDLERRVAALLRAQRLSSRRLDDFLKGLTRGRFKKSKQFRSSGDFAKANKDFEKLVGNSRITSHGSGIRSAKLPSGESVSVRPRGREDLPTIQINPPTGKTIKVRYEKPARY